jgi:hypothetical protein
MNMKTKIILTATAAIFSIFFFTSCEKIKGKGEVITETRNPGTYNSISLAMSATVYFTPDSVYSLRISGQENILREILTGVEGNSLVIRLKNGVILKNYEPIRVYITAPNVTGLDVSGSGDIFADNTWIVNDLSANISGSGNINIASVDAGRISASISGSGTIKVASGKAAREDLKISGSGTIDLRSVEAETVYATTSGSGETYIYVTSLLDVTISGSGDTWYYGTPAINTRISGSGSLHRM